MSDNEEILFAVEDGILRVTLNRPEMGNAVTQDQRARLAEWIERANEDHSIRCVVIGATGRFFCTGADLRTQREPVEPPEGQPERVVGDARRMMTRGAIATVTLDPRLREAGHRRGPGHGGRHRVPHRVRLRPRDRLRRRQVRRGLRPPRPRDRRAGRVAAPPPRRPPAREGARPPRRRRLRGAGARDRTRDARRPGRRARGDRRRARPPAGVRPHEGAHGEQVVAQPLVRRRPQHARGRGSVDRRRHGEHGRLREGVASFVERRPPNFRGF